MKKKTDYTKHLAFISITDEDVLTAVTEHLGDYGEDFNTIVIDSVGIVVTKDRKEEIEELVKEYEEGIDDEEDEDIVNEEVMFEEEDEDERIDEWMKGH
jgi:hypothetical protein